MPARQRKGDARGSLTSRTTITTDHHANGDSRGTESAVSEQSLSNRANYGGGHEHALLLHYLNAHLGDHLYGS